jgi:hypothetical protein
MEDFCGLRSLSIRAVCDRKQRAVADKRKSLATIVCEGGSISVAVGKKHRTEQKRSDINNLVRQTGKLDWSIMSAWPLFTSSSMAPIFEKFSNGVHAVIRFLLIVKHEEVIFMLSLCFYLGPLPVERVVHLSVGRRHDGDIK